MALRVRRLGAAANTAAGSITRIYTVPTGKAAILRGLSFGGDAMTYDARIVTAAVSSAYLISPIVTTAAKLAVVIPLGTVLRAGEGINAYHSAASGYTMLQGVEFDVPPPTAHRVDIINIGFDALTYTVPLGKRFRLREIIVAKFSGGGSVSVAINGIGYCLRQDFKDNETVVAGVDMSVEPGEIISVSTNIGSGHVYFSGVLEDA